MLMPFHPFWEKQNLCRLYTKLVCFYPSQWCSLVWGYGLLWWGVHAPRIGAMEPFSWGVLASWDFYLLPFWWKILFNLWYFWVLNKADSWPMSLAPTYGVSGKNGTKNLSVVRWKKGSHKSNYSKLKSLLKILWQVSVKWRGRVHCVVWN